ncbi:MAG: ribonuclease P protein component [Defluviitaleaceae bacterium]|nr:ribonuclease P protein component [Defluviitaleaceae bacterium]MCL2204313.1 ribonuclease P protein component [Defluviitaleaceae bacterium]MCL2240473.1 ribonuclease P protein component [Defluviitaleaceae bacterium]
MCCRLSPVPSLRTGRAFRRVYQGGRHVASPFFVVYRLPSCETRLGLSVSKKVGNAVVRNRVRRLIKESFRLRPPAPGMYVVVARAGVGLLPPRTAFAQVDASLGALFRRLGAVC